MSTGNHHGILLPRHWPRIRVILCAFDNMFYATNNGLIINVKRLCAIADLRIEGLRRTESLNLRFLFLMRICEQLRYDQFTVKDKNH